MEETQNNLIDNIKTDLKLKSSDSQKFVYLDQTKMEESEHNINIPNKAGAVSFSDVLKNFDMPSLINETTQTKMKNTIKNFVKNKDKAKVEIKFDDTETKVLERSQNYNKLNKDITKYQSKVKINREADVLDFTTNHQPLSFTAKAIVNNNTDLNALEKSVKDLLTKNRYDTEEKIIEEENKKLMTINPEELKKRYEDLKRVKGLLFQQELKNKRKSKIKSKLYHKIKKKQKEREERVLLEQLEDVDPEGVKTFLEKKKLARAQERIELKHSFNSKFNKTVKRYNLKNDVNVKEAIKENLKLRDELMKKIKQDDEDSEGVGEFDQMEEEDEELLGSDEDNNPNEDLSANPEEEEEEVEEDKLLVNFNENQSENPDQEEQDGRKGVWAMKFMKNAEANLQNKLRDVLNEIDSDEEEFNIDEDSDEENANWHKKQRKGEKKQKVEDDEESQDLPKNIQTNARRKNVITSDKDKKHSSHNEKPGRNGASKITSDVLMELNDDAKKYIKESDNKVNFKEDDIKKLVQMEQINEDEELFNKFLIQNEENRNEFIQAAKPKVEEPKIVAGWDTWAGDSKVIQAKEFLKKKRLQEIQNRKQSLSSAATNQPAHVKVNNSFDKKFSNFQVKELPNNVKSQEEFEKLNGTAFGKEWNSLTMYKKLIQPSIVKKIGQIIEPMRINDNTNAKKLVQIIEKLNKKKQKTKAKM